MSKTANPTLIGAFLLGALALIVGVVVFFGSSKLLTQRIGFASYFDTSVDGLQIGSKVKLRGVPVGEVTDILIRFDSLRASEITHPSITVIYELDLDRLTKDLGVDVNFRDAELYQRQVKDGLRAQLSTSSFITGLLQLSLDYDDDPEASEVGPSELATMEHNGNRYWVIPTGKTDFQEATRDVMSALGNLSETDFKGLADRLSNLMTKLSDKIEKVEIQKINEALDSIQKRIDSAEIDEALTSFSKATANLAELIEKSTGLVDKIDDQIKDDSVTNILDAFEENLDTLNDTVTTINDTVTNIDEAVGRDSKVRTELERVLTETADAAKNISTTTAVSHYSLFKC
ncbi:MAG: MlaD family protein [Verrucomicrobiota bacterium]